MHSRRPPKPLDLESLSALALNYVGRYATTRAKLCAYLRRKIRERGWEGSEAPNAEAIATRFAELGYVDDAAYALMKTRSLTGRGYGRRRVEVALRAAGIGEADGSAAGELADAQAVSAALRYAERRRLGPFAAQALTDPREKQKALAAMLRAGHSMELAQAILKLPIGSAIDLSELSAR